MNPKITSEEEILETCRLIVSKEGMNALNMRHVAQMQGIALGSLYHYFPSKDVMITSAVESVWQDIFHLNEKNTHTDSFRSYVEWLYHCVRQSKKEYPNFSMSHSMSFASSAKKDARDTMQRCFSQIEENMQEALAVDTDIRTNAFTSTFTQKDFTAFVFATFFVSLVQGNDNSRTLLQVIDRCIY